MAKGRKPWWAFFALGAGVSTVIALVASSGLAQVSIGILVILGSIFFCCAAVLLGWIRAPHKLGQPLRTILIFGLICAGMIYLGKTVWPIPSPLPPLPRAHIRIDNFEFLKVVANKPIAVNLFFGNDGNGEVTDSKIFALIARTTTTDDRELRIKTEDYLWDQFARSPKTQASSHALPAHGLGRWTTLYGESLTPGQLTAFRRGQFFIWFMGTVAYRDATGEQGTDFCVFYKGDPKVVFSCSSHNGDTKTTKQLLVP